jgi:Porin subfamily
VLFWLIPAYIAFYTIGRIGPRTAPARKCPALLSTMCEPKWRTSLFGGYVNIDYNSTATNLINASLPAGSTCARGPGGVVGAFGAVTPGVGNSCSPDWSFYEIGTRTQWNPVAQLDIGLQVMYTRVNTAYKGAAVYAAKRSTAGGHPHRRPGRLVGDIPMAA